MINKTIEAQEEAGSDDKPLPPVGSGDRDALEGERAPAGLQAGAVASTGPV